MMGLTGTKGGSGVWQRIISEMAEHDVYIEAFWGRGTIARKKRLALTVGIDRDPDAIRDGRALGAKMFLADGIQFLKYYFDLSSADAHARSRETSAKAARGMSHNTASPAGDAVNGDARVTPFQALSAEQLAPPRLAAPAADAANGAATLALPRDPATPAEAALATFWGAPFHRHFVYLDPPYLGCRNYYKFGLTEAEHLELCRVFTALPCPASLSGYWTALYAEKLKGCRFIKIPTVNRRGKRVMEVLWMNYPPPARYHDTRFVGDCRRGRERIRRRVKNWRENMAEMQIAERQAVWEACDAVYRGEDLRG